MNRWEHALEDEGQVTLIVGEAGSGIGMGAALP